MRQSVEQRIDRVINNFLPATSDRCSYRFLEWSWQCPPHWLDQQCYQQQQPILKIFSGVNSHG